MDDQDKILDLLRQQVQAEMDKASELRRQNNLAEESLKTLRKTQQVETQRTRIWLQISEDSANLVQQVPELALLIHGFAEKLEELGDRLDRLELGLTLILSGGARSDRAGILVEDIEKSKRRRLIEQHKRRLEKLEIKRASYGDLEAPAHLLLEIEDLENKIRQLEG